MQATPSLEEAAQAALDYLNEATNDEFARGTDHNIRWALSQALGITEDRGGTTDYWDDETLEDATSGIILPAKLQLVR